MLVAWMQLKRRSSQTSMALSQSRSLGQRRLRRIIATNAGEILASARVPSHGNPMAPYVVLKNISAFLKSMIEFNANNPQLPAVLKQEKDKVDEAIRQLTADDSVVCPPQILPGRPSPIGSPGPHVAENPASATSPTPLTEDQCQTQRLVTIFNNFGLQNGTQVFLTDMTNLVNIDLENRFAAGEIPQPTTKILQASGQDLYVAHLERIGQPRSTR